MWRNVLLKSFTKGNTTDSENGMRFQSAELCPRWQWPQVALAAGGTGRRWQWPRMATAAGGNGRGWQWPQVKMAAGGDVVDREPLLGNL